MQVSVEKTGELERRLSFTIPSADVDAAAERKLQSMSRTANIKGLRPGKVPVSVLRKRFGGDLRSEALGEAIESSFRDAVREQSLRPVGQPVIEKIDEGNAGEIAVTATLEVFPQFELADLAAQSVTRPTGTITDTDVDGMLDDLRRQRVHWVDVDRASRDGDRLTIGFVGTLDGKPFDGGSAKGVDLVLGSGRMIPGFEAALTGAATGETVEFDVSFPADYGASHLAGKPAHFSVDVTAVAEPSLPEVGEEFVRSFGVESGDVAEFRREVQNNMQREFDDKLGAKTKDRVLEMLLRAHDFEVPRALIDDEVTRLQSQAADQVARSGGAAKSLTREMFEQNARRRVRLGVLLNRIVEEHSISVDEARVHRRVHTIASSYENPEQVERWLMSDENQRESIRAAVLEDQVVDWVLERAAVTDEPVGFKDVMGAGGGR